MCPIDVTVRVPEEFDGLVSVPWLRQIAERALRVASGGKEAGLSVVIADDDLVRGLNKQYRGLDENTDVLAFSFAHAGEYYGEGEPQPGPGEESEFALPPGQESSLGEVIISYPQAQRQAAQSAHTVEKELAVLLTHGVLHLLGHDHEKREEAMAMERVESHVLAEVWGEG